MTFVDVDISVEDVFYTFTVSSDGWAVLTHLTADSVSY